MVGSAPCLTTACTHCASVQMLVSAQLAWVGSGFGLGLGFRVGVRVRVRAQGKG